MTPAWKATSGGIGASLLAAVVFDAVPRLLRWIEVRGTISDARSFFGAAFQRGEGTLIAAQWNASGGTEPQGLMDAIDMMGLVDVARQLTILFQQPIKICTDKGIDVDQGSSFVTFGLGNNLYAKLIGDYGRDRLFTWQFRSKAEDHIGFRDGKTMRGYSRTEDFDYGFVVRVVPAHHPAQVWLLCGGANNHGTAGAGWYLSEHWRDLMNDWRNLGSDLGPGTVCAALISVKPRELRSATPLQLEIEKLDKQGKSVP
ncbi:MAG: hypothetical protein AMXMBFR58_28260 [Phycisphaerae bacterium]